MKLSSRMLLVGALAVAAAHVVAGKAISSGNVVGMLKIASAANYTIIAVPWLDCAGGDAIKVANLVQTVNLDVGDKLFVYNAATGAYAAYQFNGTAWEGLTTVVKIGQEDTTIPGGDAAKDTVTRGLAVQLYRKNPSADKPIYLAGQAPDTAVGDVTAVLAGTAETPAYNLVASPKAEDFVLNADGKIENPNSGDVIVVRKGGTEDAVYTYDEKGDGKWGYNVAQEVEKTARSGYKFTTTVITRVTEGEMSVPAGIGFWYVSKGSKATKINW